MVEYCQHLLAKGSCPDRPCAFSHDIPICDVCRRIFASASDLQSHLVIHTHEKTETGKNLILHCPMCNTKVGATNWEQHLLGRRHQLNSKEDGQPPPVDTEEPLHTPGMAYCDLCQEYLPESGLQHHLNGPKHMTKERSIAYKTALEEAEKDKNGIVIPTNLDFGILDVDSAGRGANTEHVIRTTIPTSQVLLVETQLASGKGTAQFSPFSVTIKGNNRIIKFSQEITFILSFCHTNRGHYCDRIDFIFEDMQTRKKFLISRPLDAIIGNESDHELLKQSSPYKPRQRTDRQLETEVVPGVPPSASGAISWKDSLPHAEIPQQLVKTLSIGVFREVIERIRKVFLPETFNSDTYEKLFQNLLWIEEYRMEHDLETYDLYNASLKSYNSYYFLSVPGLIEKRPTVLIGDRILFQKHDAPQGHWYEGAVHIVRKEEVGLKFDPSFGEWSREEVYNVHFKLNRNPMRRQHQALNTDYPLDRLLFPFETQLQTPRNPVVTVINPLIGTNPQQLQAVTSIVGQRAGSIPFVVFGPPGTGKTMTIVEAILQILRIYPKARVFACAPSNSAADLIALRLTSLDTNDLFRFYAPSRGKEQVPDGLRPYSYWRAGTRDEDHGSHALPPLTKVKKFRVIVTTCVSASFAYGVGIPRGHFSHIFVDEAGQATEPEVMIAVKTMADDNTNVVLSGDPKQLGPVVRSNIAQELGLERSYMERLVERDIYDERRWQGITLVKLVKNFRSHNAILKYPNGRFYNKSLESCGHPRLINSYLYSSHLVSKTFPVVFHAISGKDDREAASPSFFNIHEASQVKEYVRALLSDTQHPITDNDIGVISPYHSQCLKIRNVLRAFADGVKVGSVEEFQGQERRVIIISTVRSSRDFIQYDLKQTLGFVANPRRFNVAVTRAQALLIVIGDPNVLSLDPLWRGFLNYVYLNNGWRGQPITWDPLDLVDEEGKYDEAIRVTAEVDMNNLTRMMVDLTVGGLDIADDDDDPEANVDRDWGDWE